MNIDWLQRDFSSFRAKINFNLRISYLICNGPVLL